MLPGEGEKAGPLDRAVRREAVPGQVAAFERGQVPELAARQDHRPDGVQVVARQGVPQDRPVLLVRAPVGGGEERAVGVEGAPLLMLAGQGVKARPPGRRPRQEAVPEAVVGHAGLAAVPRRRGGHGDGVVEHLLSRPPAQQFRPFVVRRVRTRPVVEHAPEDRQSRWLHPAVARPGDAPPPAPRQCLPQPARRTLLLAGNLAPDRLDHGLAVSPAARRAADPDHDDNDGSHPEDEEDSDDHGQPHGFSIAITGRSMET